MMQWFTSGRIVDLILVLVAFEALLLWAWHRRTGRGPRWSQMAPTLASGALLLVALRAALSDLWWGWTAAALTLALLAHLVDLTLRWR